MDGVLQKKKVHTEDTTFHGEKKKEKKKKKKKKKKKRKNEKKKKQKKGAEYGYRTSELRLDRLMVSPPTPQRHELGNSLHATFLYPT